MVRNVRPPKTPEVVARLETAPGEVAQVDFGDVGVLVDPRTGHLRRAYVFTLVLGWSRHMYAEFVFDQKIPTWLQCHQHAFEFLGGVTNRVVLDNLKAAIIQAYTHDKDVEVQRAYAECAEHYGFLIDPCWPARPEHKGKVERGGVGYIKQSFIPLLLPETTLPDANRRLRDWLVNVAGVREHGTTHEAPLARFTTTERAALRPLPPNAYDPAIWKQVKLHRDGHVVFEKAYYSAPNRYVGQTLWLRAGLREIRLFSSTFELITSHPRATQPGERQTQTDHLPPHKLSGLLASRERCQTQAAAIGPATVQVIAEMLASRPVDKLRSAGRVLKLAELYTPARLEAACQRGQRFGDTSHAALKHILDKRLDQLALPTPGTPANQVPLFARPAHELADAITRGATWN
jgi:hypothetical protein